MNTNTVVRVLASVARFLGECMGALVVFMILHKPAKVLGVTAGILSDLGITLLLCTFVVLRYRSLKVRLGVHYLISAVGLLGAVAYSFPYWRYGLYQFWYLLLGEGVVLYIFRHRLLRWWDTPRHWWPRRQWSRFIHWVVGPRPAWALLPLNWAALGVLAWIHITWVSPMDCSATVKGVEHVVSACTIPQRNGWERWYATLSNQPERLDAAPRDLFPTADGTALFGTFGSEDTANGWAPIVRFERQLTTATHASGSSSSQFTALRYRPTAVVWAHSPFAGVCHRSGRCVVTSPTSEGLIIIDAATGNVICVLKVPDRTFNDVELTPQGQIVMIVGQGRGSDIETVKDLPIGRVKRLPGIDLGREAFVWAYLDIEAEEISMVPMLGSYNSDNIHGERFFVRPISETEAFFGKPFRMASTTEGTITSLHPNFFKLFWSGGDVCGAAFDGHTVYANYTFMGITAYRRVGSTWEEAKTVRMPYGGRALEYDAKRDLLYRANYFNGDIEVIDFKSGETLKVFRIGSRPRHMHLANDKLYVMFVNGGVVIDLATALADVPWVSPVAPTKVALNN